jgi:hypothetical protein
LIRREKPRIPEETSAEIQAVKRPIGIGFEDSGG